VKREPQSARERALLLLRAQEKWYERTRYQILLYIGGIILVVLALWLALDLYIDPRTSTQKKDLVQALALILAGVAAAIGIFFTWRGQRITRIGQDMTQQSTREQLQLTRDSLESTQKDTEHQLRLTEQGQITERFTRAIDQLGATDTSGDRRFRQLEIRVGGIYALEQIAKEAKEYYWPIMQILTSYVREVAPRRQFEGEGEKNKPDIDIQAIITVLRQRTHSPYHREPESLDLVETDLREAYLWRANLSGVLLGKTDLRGAYLGEADLSLAYLEGADLSGADLSGANLEGANLEGANLSEAVNLTQDQLEATKSGDQNTQLPSDRKPPTHWGMETDVQEED
jgi:Pentapeptide repeats (8 copies)